jgi:hypothetical protein
VLRTFVDDDGFIRHETLQLDVDETTTSIESEWQSTGANSWEQLITFARLA